jgi:hypothetical protein
VPPLDLVIQTWIDRRDRRDWEAVYRAHMLSGWQDAELPLPRLRIADLPPLLRQPSRDLARFLRKQQLPRVGFRVIAEPRTHERVAAMLQKRAELGVAASAQRLPAHAVDELPDGQTETNQHHLARDLDPPSTPKRPPRAHPICSSLGSSASHRGLRAARTVRASGPVVGIC